MNAPRQTRASLARLIPRLTGWRITVFSSRGWLANFSILARITRSFDTAGPRQPPAIPRSIDAATGQVFVFLSGMSVISKGRGLEFVFLARP